MVGLFSDSKRFSVILSRLSNLGLRFHCLVIGYSDWFCRFQKCMWKLKRFRIGYKPTHDIICWHVFALYFSKQQKDKEKRIAPVLLHNSPIKHELTYIFIKTLTARALREPHKESYVWNNLPKVHCQSNNRYKSWTYREKCFPVKAGKWEIIFPFMTADESFRVNVIGFTLPASFNWS